MTRRHTSNFTPLFSGLLVLLAAVGIAFALMLGGCAYEEGDRVTSPTEPTPPPPAPVQVDAGGVCDLSGTSIVCGDDSSSTPRGHLDEVEWVARTDGGARVVRTIRSKPDATVVFAGLPTGEYTIDQTVTADDGKQDKASYGPFTILGGG